MKLPLHTAVAATAAALAVALTISGCSHNAGSGASGKSSGTTTASASNGDAATVLKQAADVMRKVTGVHVEVTVNGHVPNLEVTKLSGDVSNTPQTVATGTATVLLGQKSEDAKFVYVDGHLYSDLGQPGKYTDFGNGDSIYDVQELLDPKEGLANVLAELKDPSTAGSEQVSGINTTRITGNSSADDIEILEGARLTSQGTPTVPTTFWIASDGSYRLVKMALTPTSDSSVTLTLSEWGKQVTATKPS